MIHSFLLIGQSNAAGRGFLKEAAPLDTCGGKLMVLRNGRWLTMFRPVNPDRPFSGTCLAESFAKAYHLAYPEAEVGIIPCADGGTTLDQWQPGEILFDNAVNCAKLAMRTSHLAGVLWHQGEGDCGAQKYPLYREKFERIKETLRKELGLPELPVLVGGLGDYLMDCTLDDQLKNYRQVNLALQQLADADPVCAYVSAEGLGANPDNLHFSAASLDAFGIRYFEAYQKLCGGNAVLSEEKKEDSTLKTAMELL